MFRELRFLLRLTRSHGIARRYFITNGFDGALTMLGLVTGFYVTNGGVEITVALGACLGTAIALGVSGLTSAYISESAERQRELQELEQAMVADLGESSHGRASRVVPFIIALVNGAAPFVMALLIVSPLWWVHQGLALPLDPFELSMGISVVVLFLLGVFIGRITGTFWLWAGLRTLLIALLTASLIFFFEP